MVHHTSVSLPERASARTLSSSLPNLFSPLPARRVAQKERNPEQHKSMLATSAMLYKFPSTSRVATALTRFAAGLLNEVATNGRRAPNPINVLTAQLHTSRPRSLASAALLQTPPPSPCHLSPLHTPQNLSLCVLVCTNLTWPVLTRISLALAFRRNLSRTRASTILSEAALQSGVGWSIQGDGRTYLNFSEGRGVRRHCGGHASASHFYACYSWKTTASSWCTLSNVMEAVTNGQVLQVQAIHQGTFVDEVRSKVSPIPNAPDVTVSSVSLRLSNITDLCHTCNLLGLNGVLCLPDHIL